MSKTPINKPIFLAHTSRYHSATHSTYPLFSYLRSMKNIMQHIVPRKQPQRKVQSSSEVYVCPVSATSQNPITSFHILNSALTHTFSAKEKDSETGLSYFGSRYYSSDLSIWLSVDPMSDKYPSLSPYTYCANNPIKLVDPNGAEVYLEGDDVAAALQQLQNQTSLKLSIDQNGKLNYEGVAENKIDELLINAITNEDITVNMLCSTKDRIGGINLVNGGAFMGNTYEDGKVCTDQYVCPSALAQFDKSVKDKIPGLTMVHELAESFYGGEIALERKQGSPYGETPGSTYDEAHWCANQIVIGNRGPVYKINPFKANPNYNPNLPLSPFNVPYLQGEFKVQDGWRRVTDKNGM